MKLSGLIAGAVVLGTLASFADVTRTATKPVIDGRLDDACWAAAKWEGGFSSIAVRAASLGGAVPKTEFAVVADDDAVYFAVKCYDPNPAELTARKDTSLWVTDDVELHLCPSGRGFDIYHFAISPVSKDVCAEFWSEGGIIQPDPFAPEWQYAVGVGKDMWVAEFALPLSAFYMTRNADWKTTWLMNVARTVVNPEKNPARVQGHYGWAPLERAFLEPQNWRTLAGFPTRRAEDDLLVRSALAKMEAKDADGFTGKLRLEVTSACAGRFAISISSGDKPLETELKAGDNVVELPCRYRENGRFKTHIEVTNLAANRTLRRDYPVLVNFEPIAVRFTTPCFRGNFYPGQDAGTVAGTVKVAGGKDAEMTLEGPGFPTRTLTVRGGEGTFSFDTKGFQHGDAYLTVKAGDETVRKRIRNLPPTGHTMAWIENGHVVVNGQPVFRRSIYADGYRQGKYFRERFEKDLPSFCLTKGFKTSSVTLTSAEERSEGVFDRKPSAAVLARIDKIIEANRDKDIVGYYISDEPECRLLSPIYLKHLYDHVAEKDPYRILFTASRGGKAYTDIADLIETHPYMDCQRKTEKGERKYGTHPRDMPRFLDDFDAWNRPDKCLGFLPTCFAYRWTSILSDYPTFDEYIAHCWGMLIAGAKTLWPYAGHDLGDREALYEGVRYVFRQTAAYEKFLLLGKHTRHPRTNDVDRGTWELEGDVLDVSVDYKTMKTTVRVPAKYDATLESYEAVKARVDRGEAARLCRDNQLRGRYDFVKVKSNMSGNWGAGVYKLIDGSLEMVTRDFSGPQPYIELSFDGELAFDRVRVFGTGLDGMKVEVPEDDGWRALDVTPAAAEAHRWEASFGKVVKAKGLRISWAGAKPREVTELELPRLKVRPFAANERVTFFGDSITHGGAYHSYLQLFWDTRFPGSGVRLMNCGRSGGTAGGGLSRWDWDVLPQQAERIFVMFGMNDVSRDVYAAPEAANYTERTNREHCVALYCTNMTEIVSRIKSAGKEAVLMTPTPYDQYGPTYTAKNFTGCNEPGLAALAAFDRTLAAQEGVGLVDLHRPLTEFDRKQTDFKLCRDDRVHPTPTGHLIVFAEILRAMGVSPVVDEATFDAAGNPEASFAYAPKALPFPVTDAYRTVDRVYPLTETVNREMLKVANLPAGRYSLAADGATLCVFTAEELAQGVNLALLETPNAKIAREAGKVAQALCGTQSKIRGLALIEFSARKKGADPKKFDDVCAKMEAEVAHMKKMKYSWAGYYANCLKQYRKDKANEAKLRADEETQRDKLAAFRPAKYTLSISPVQ